MRFRSFCWLPLLVLLAWGCSKDYSYEGGNANRRCVDCEYLPVCDSSFFRYVDSNGTRIDTLDNQMFVLGDSTINGRRYSKVSGFATFNTGLFANCDNGDYRLLFPLTALGINLDSMLNALLQVPGSPFPIPPGLIRAPQTITTSVLKVGVPVGGTWLDTIYNLSLPPLVTLFAGLRYTVVAKGVQRTVFSNTYNDVIHVRSTTQVISTLISLPVNFSIDYYFAKGVGLIEVQVRQPTGPERVLKLYSYTL
jgi:hypothetical protein